MSSQIQPAVETATATTIAVLKSNRGMAHRPEAGTTPARSEIGQEEHQFKHPSP
jgi:hypothetical protein